MEASCAQMYSEQFSTMITGWRNDWGIGDIPFLFVQMQSVLYPDNDLNWPLVRQGQLDALSLNNTGMVTVLDLTDGDLHPANKRPIAARLAAAERSVAYGDSSEYSGPTLDTASLVDTRIMVTFDHAGGGLAVKGDTLVGFELMDSSAIYSAAEAAIRGDKVAIKVEGLTEPFRVRYGYKNYPDGNLYNSDKLPASPFITDLLEGPSP